MTRTAGISHISRRATDAAAAIAALPSWLLWLCLFAAVAVSHVTLLHLPYYWDEGGYYIPAALDFYHTGALIPHYTNAHTPLPNVMLGTLWHIVGFHILATRLFVCAFAAIGLAAVFRLAQRLLDAGSALALTLLTAVYPIWFAQSTLAHADIFAAAFTLAAFAVYLPAVASSAENERRFSAHPRITVAILFTLAALSKETSILQPVALLTVEAFLFLRSRRSPEQRRRHLAWMIAFVMPIFPLIAWFAYHHVKTGFTFGNPEYLRYNATANFTAAHVFTALRYRFVHLFWQRNIWFPILLAVASLLLPRRPQDEVRSLTAKARWILAALIVANWIAFSIMGGALLTRYLLPVYPLILLLCVDLWRERTRALGWLTLITAAAFLSGLWFSPPTAFAPEDTLVYRDMILVNEDAIHFVDQHYPDAVVLTAWPVSTDLFNPELGYTDRRIRVDAIEDFSPSEIARVAQDPTAFDTAIVFTTHYIAPSFRHYLISHPNSPRGRAYSEQRVLTPREIAVILGGSIVWQESRNGESAAVLRFPRSYAAELHRPPTSLPQTSAN